MTIAERVKAIRARALVRRWEYRQRNLAHGAWDRFRAALAHASDAYVIDDATATALIAEGFESDDRGRDLEPPRTLVWITADRAARLQGAHPMELRLGPQLLAASLPCTGSFRAERDLALALTVLDRAPGHRELLLARVGGLRRRTTWLPAEGRRGRENLDGQHTLEEPAALTL